MAPVRTAPKGKKKQPPFSWTQPCCPTCWVGLKLKIGKRSEEMTAQHVFCTFCRNDIPELKETYAIRVNPGTTPYPTLRKEE